MPTSPELFPQYSSGIADQSYQFDFVKRVTLATGATATVVFPASSNIIRIRNVYIEDVTVAVGGTAPSSGVACYMRVDGQAAGAGLAVDGSSSRIIKAGANRTVARFSAAENGITLQNPNTGTVTIMVELGA